MAQGRQRPIQAREWCDAIMAHSCAQVEWLLDQPDARAVINDPFLWSRQPITVLCWAIEEGLSLSRILLLVDEAGAAVDALALCKASKRNRYDVTTALYVRGARHENLIGFRAHLFMEQTLGAGDAGVLRLLLDHPQFWAQSIVEEEHGQILEIARHRRARATRAARVVYYLAKKRGLGADMARALSKNLMQTDNVMRAEWGLPPPPGMGDLRWWTATNPPYLIVLAAVVCLLVLLMCFTLCFTMPASQPQQEPWVRGPRGDPGEMGPPGPPGIVITNGVGIQVPGLGQSIEIKNLE